MGTERFDMLMSATQRYSTGQTSTLNDRNDASMKPFLIISSANIVQRSNVFVI
jgi:hypothetical protein